MRDVCHFVNALYDKKCDVLEFVSWLKMHNLLIIGRENTNMFGLYHGEFRAMLRRHGLIVVQIDKAFDQAVGFPYPGTGPD